MFPYVLAFLGLLATGAIGFAVSRMAGDRAGFVAGCILFALGIGLFRAFAGF